MLILFDTSEEKSIYLQPLEVNGPFIKKNIFYDGTTKKFPSSDKKKVCLVKNLCFSMYLTTDVLIRNIAPNKNKLNYSKNTAN